MRWTVALLLVAFVAGCTAPSALHGPDQPVDASRDLQDPAAIVAGSGEPLATVSFVAASHNEWADEEHRDEAPYAVTLAYHGIQNVIDGYGRERPAVVYSINSTRPGDEAKDDDPVDERAIMALAPNNWGYVSLAMEGAESSFALFLRADEFALPATGALSFLLIHAAGGDLAHEVLVYEDAYGQVFVSLKTTDERPLPGDCTPYQLASRFVFKSAKLQAASADAARESPKPSEPHRHLMCMEPGSRTPLWNWSGNSTAWSSLERVSEGIDPPARHGEALSPVEYQLEPWAELGDIDGGLLVGTTLAPPSNGADWAASIHTQVEGLYRGRGYADYVEEQGQPAIQVSVTFPESQMAASVGVQQSIVYVGGPKSAWQAIVTKAHEGGSNQGFAVSNGEPSTADLPPSSLPMPVAGDIQKQLNPFLQGDAEAIIFIAYPDVYLDGQGALWMREADCQGDWGSLQFIDAQHGLMFLTVEMSGACPSVVNSAIVTDALAFEHAWLMRLARMDDRLTQVNRVSTLI